MKSYVYGISIIIIGIILYLYKKAYATKVILFHSPKCPYCIKMMPEWNKFISRTRFSLNISTYNINVDNENDSEIINKLKENYNISSWPTIIIVKDIKWREYEGELTSNDIWGSSIAV